MMVFMNFLAMDFDLHNLQLYFFVLCRVWCKWSMIYTKPYILSRIYVEKNVKTISVLKYGISAQI
jgi:hypothetical protein